MPDISMCFGEDCPKKNECYRFRAVPNEYGQSYAGFVWDNVKQCCDAFMELCKHDNVVKPCNCKKDK